MAAYLLQIETNHPPTTAKVPVPFVVDWAGGYQKVSDGAAAEYPRAKRSIGLRQHVAAMRDARCATRDAVTEDGVDLLGYTTWGLIAAFHKSCYITSQSKRPASS